VDRLVEGGVGSQFQHHHHDGPNVLFPLLLVPVLKMVSLNEWTHLDLGAFDHDWRMGLVQSLANNYLHLQRKSSGLSQHYSCLRPFRRLRASGAIQLLFAEIYFFSPIPRSPAEEFGISPSQHLEEARLTRW